RARRRKPSALQRSRARADRQNRAGDLPRRDAAVVRAVSAPRLSNKLPIPVIAEIEKVAMRAARAAGRIHLSRLRRISVELKSSPIDLVTEADREAEAAIIEVIRRAYPAHAVLAEESGASAERSEHRWIVDPLDGTT